MEKRDSTQFVIVSFTGDSTLTYEDIKNANNGEIGFHYIIDSQGQILMGRHSSKVGAYSPDFDETSLGVCVIGERHEMEDAQSIALTLLLENLKAEFPEIESAKYIYNED
jgi:N-acetyl-anhydromuramyl-L-alanine amidase AmpD